MGPSDVAERRPPPAARPALSASIRKMLTGLALFGAVCVVAVIGYLLAGWRVDDAIYMVVITIFGVGYGEVQPIESWPLRALTIVVIIGGYGAVIYTVGGFIQMVVDGELNRALGARRMTKYIDNLEGHAIICGFGRMGTALAAELAAAGRPFVAIESDGGTGTHAEANGYLVITGDATDEDVLAMAGIDRAGVLATVLSDDATNVFVTLTARAMNPELTIIARGENVRTESKLLTCGADKVVLPTAIGATKMSQLITRPTAEEMLERLATSGATGMDLDHIGLGFDEIVVAEDSPLAFRTLGEIEVRGAHGYLIVGVRGADGTTTLHPPAELRLAAGYTVLLLGYHDDMPELVGRFATVPTTIRYRGVTTEA